MVLQRRIYWDFFGKDLRIKVVSSHLSAKLELQIGKMWIYDQSCSWSEKTEGFQNTKTTALSFLIEDAKEKKISLTDRVRLFLENKSDTQYNEIQVGISIYGIIKGAI